jgi:phosphoenolpyruvate synthase/pyruvate phosphate dikinase
MEIIPLVQLRDKDIQAVGAKASSLAKLLHHNFSVPEAFVVSAEAYRAFLKQNDLLSSIRSQLSKVTVDDIHSIDYASRYIHDEILSHDIPQEIVVEIMQQYKHINADLVAVRSSVFTEDVHALPWTGKLDTFLRIPSTDIVETIKKCWASLYRADSLYHLLSRNEDPEQISMSVIVQRMVDSQASGICYSTHPVTEDQNQLVIEAGIGLGNPSEKRVFTPDTYVVQKDPLEILEKNIHKQEVAIAPNDGEGTTIVDLNKEEAEEPSLSDEEILELSKLVTKMQKDFKSPVVIEWVLSGKFYFVQARETGEH